MSPLAISKRIFFTVSMFIFGSAPAAMAATAGGAQHGAAATPSVVWCLPFALLLLMIALLPQVPHVAHWWDRNRNKLLVAGLLSLVTGLYYLLRGYGIHGSEPGLAAVAGLVHHALIKDYFPFIVLLFSLFVISGGIRLTGDIPAHPLTNTSILLLGAMLANVIGTTGAAMLLIRPLLQINSERKHVTHTVIFFIFLVCNIGGCLLPIGDPPLFLGYLRGVPFLWTAGLIKEWMTCAVILLGIYWIMDHIAWRKEAKPDIQMDETVRQPIRLEGKANFLLLATLVLAVAVLVPGQRLPTLGVNVPDVYLREWLLLALAGISWWLTPRSVRTANSFTFHPIAEVACLFIGIFITVQIPIEILQIKGPQLGLDTPLKYFWVTGAFSSVLDNAPTYVIFFETAGALTPTGVIMVGLKTATEAISVPILAAISCGAVFMGAMTYIGNGPNFMVKSIAERSGIKMPSFMGYMGYSFLILVPVFIIISWLFFI